MSTKQALMMTFAVVVAVVVLLFFVFTLAFKVAEERASQLEQKHDLDHVDGFGSFAPQKEKKVIKPLPATLRVENFESADKRVLGGLASGPGIEIAWKGEQQPNAATPLDVLKVTAQRMSYLQGTPQASDDQAKALFALLEAIDYIEGTSEVSAPVGPGFVPSSPNGD